MVRGGYERVLEGRLYDARFFWDADRRKSLSQHAWALSGMAFQKELGTMADKVGRTGTTALAIADVLGVSATERATLEAALPVFRADLATEMVAELPELEGTMARAYARAEGAPEEVASALEDGVLPRGPNDALPATRVGAVLAVADRLDKLVGFFALGKRPSGSADPFALRRDAIAVARVLAAQGWRLPLPRLIEAAGAAYADGPVEVTADTAAAVEAFVWDRVAGLLHDEGPTTNEVRAATVGSRSVIAAARRAHLLRALAADERPEAREAFAGLLALYKRAANLAEKAEAGVPLPALEAFGEPAERALAEALPAARRSVEGLLAHVREHLPPWDLGRGPADAARRRRGAGDRAAAPEGAARRLPRRRPGHGGRRGRPAGAPGAARRGRLGPARAGRARVPGRLTAAPANRARRRSRPRRIPPGAAAGGAEGGT